MAAPNQRSDDTTLSEESVTTADPLTANSRLKAWVEEIAELDIPEDLDPRTPLQLLGGGTLVFDQFGRLKLHIHKDLEDWRRQLRRVEYLHRAGRSDRSRRLGFSDGAGRGEAFAELHNTELNSGEAW